MPATCPLCGRAGAGCGRSHLTKPIIGEWPKARPPVGSVVLAPREVNVIESGVVVRKVLAEPEPKP